MSRNLELERKVETHIEQDLGAAGADVAISAAEGVVTLAGFVKSYADRTVAEVAAKRTPGVKAVVNDVEVRLPVINERSDPEIAREAARALERLEPVVGQEVQVVVCDGDLRLEGRVAREEDRAVAERIVGRLKGVLSVQNAIAVDGRLARRAGRALESPPVETEQERPPRVVLDSARVREAVAVVHGDAALDRLVDALVLCGVDRADISLMASYPAVMEKLHRSYRDPVEIADDPGVPRCSLITRDDVTAASALVFGTLVAIGTLAAAVPILASGGALATAVAAAVGGGAASGALARLINRHVVQAEDAALLEDELNAGGLVVFVRINDPDKEGAVMQVMRGAGARSVHVHELELMKTLEDVPFHEVAPLVRDVAVPPSGTTGVQLDHLEERATS
jgi:osmotically-inducible protein OsmY